MLQRTLAIATSAGMIIAEPTLYVMVPKYSVALNCFLVGPPLLNHSLFRIGVRLRRIPAHRLRNFEIAARIHGYWDWSHQEKPNDYSFTNVRHPPSTLYPFLIDLDYAAFGCYITKYGVPTRNCGFIRWECPIQSFVCRGSHVLLVSQTDIEVRHIPTGRLIQVIEGNEIRLLQKLPKGEGRTLAARRGEKDDSLGLSDQLFELVETSALSAQTWNESDLMWEGWET